MKNFLSLKKKVQHGFRTRAQWVKVQHAVSQSYSLLGNTVFEVCITSISSTNCELEEVLLSACFTLWQCNVLQKRYTAHQLNERHRSFQTAWERGAHLYQEYRRITKEKECRIFSKTIVCKMLVWSPLIYQSILVDWCRYVNLLRNVWINFCPYLLITAN